MSYNKDNRKDEFNVGRPGFAPGADPPPSSFRPMGSMPPPGPIQPDDPFASQFQEVDRAQNKIDVSIGKAPSRPWAEHPSGPGRTIPVSPELFENGRLLDYDKMDLNYYAAKRRFALERAEKERIEQEEKVKKDLAKKKKDDKENKRPGPGSEPDSKDEDQNFPN